ncbi:MAG: hypothetical protein AAF492_18835, partial [Verrucomicrobiota bacterium]
MIRLAQYRFFVVLTVLTIGLPGLKATADEPIVKIYVKTPRHNSVALLPIHAKTPAEREHITELLGQHVKKLYRYQTISPAEVAKKIGRPEDSLNDLK